MARRSAEEATPRLLKSFEDYLGEDEDTEKLFWMVLAAAQFETGRMLPEVRDRALAIIEGGGDVNRWLEDGDEVLARQRLRVLERRRKSFAGRSRSRSASAAGVTPNEEVDAARFGRSMRWGLVPTSVCEAQLLARERARD